MKKSEVKVGQSYRVKVSGKLVDVRITAENPGGGWDGINTATNRSIRIKSAQRLRRPVEPRPAKRKRIVSLAEYEADAKGKKAASPKRATRAKKVAKATGKAKTPKQPHTGERDAKGGQPKRMSALDAAAKVLAERDAADGPLSCGQMIERMAAKGYWSPARGGKTPANTLYSAILREINKKGEDSRFEKVERGKFGLKH